MSTEIRVAAEQLLTFTSNVFACCGLSEPDAQQAADVLIASDLRGIDSHGVARLWAYVDNLQKGATNPRPRIQIVRETPSTATIDGDNGLGLVVAAKANALAMEKARAHGSGWVAVRNSSHFGIAGYYTLQAARHDLIGWAFTNTSKVVAPLGSAERMLGTNPISVAIPAKSNRPIVIDMSTTTVSWGKIEIALRKQEQIPMGWAMDEHGQITIDPQRVFDSGTLLPVGGTVEASAPKGYCLTAMVDLLAGVLSGANWGPFTPPFVVQQDSAAERVGLGLGHLFGALRVDGFRSADEFKESVDHWIATMRSSRPKPGSNGASIPGDPEWQAMDERQAKGIPLHASVAASLAELGRRLGIQTEFLA
jgi:LDH2 family malate/lactate/ureidoglycolate dehydrogenase